jgi:hypothetical protein
VNRRDIIEAASTSLTVGLTRPGFADGSEGGIPSEQDSRALGSGHFGKWITDEKHGLPVYRYTCDQRTDPRAKARMHEDFLGAADHLHAVGNDRPIAAASNYGYVQVRQDEGSPKYLNDHAPLQNRFGGGTGYSTNAIWLCSMTCYSRSAN